MEVAKSCPLEGGRGDAARERGGKEVPADRSRGGGCGPCRRRRGLDGHCIRAGWSFAIILKS